jgi:GAF domain-containing protein
MTALSTGPSVAVPTKSTLADLTAGKRPAKLLTSAMKLWYLKVMGDGLNTPTPRDKPEYKTGYTAWNTLLVGNGPTHGWGVTTHGLSLTGQLGVALNRHSGQAVDVEYVGDELMNAATTLDWLGGTDVEDYDLIVLVLSMNDALRLTPADEWAENVSGLIKRLREDRAMGTPLLVVGMQPVATVAGYSNAFGVIAQKHADKLNAIMEQICREGGDAFMYLPAPKHEAGRPYGSPAVYAQWADDIASYGAHLLPAGVPSERPERKKQWQWAGTEKALGTDGVDRTEALRQLAEEARAEFKLPIAYVSVMEENLQLFPAATGPQAASVPRHLSYCDETSKQEGPLVVPNGKKDERFKDNAYIDITHMPFYVGEALRDRDNNVIGTFCLMAPFPRPAKSVNMERFEDYVQRAQDALWAIEDGE